MKRSSHRRFLASIWHGSKSDRAAMLCHCGTTHVIPDCHVRGAHAKRSGA